MKDFPRYGKRPSKNLVRKKTVTAKRSSYKLAVYWIVMIVVALLFVQQRINYIRTEKKVQQLMEKKNEVQLSILPYKLEERYLTQQEKVEKIATDEIGLQIPRQVQTITVNVGEDSISIEKPQ